MKWSLTTSQNSFIQSRIKNRGAAFRLPHRDSSRCLSRIIDNSHGSRTIQPAKGRRDDSPHRRHSVSAPRLTLSEVRTSSEAEIRLPVPNHLLHQRSDAGEFCQQLGRPFRSESLYHRIPSVELGPLGVSNRDGDIVGVGAEPTAISDIVDLCFFVGPARPRSS